MKIVWSFATNTRRTDDPSSPIGVSEWACGDDGRVYQQRFAAVEAWKQTGADARAWVPTDVVTFTEAELRHQHRALMWPRDVASVEAQVQARLEQELAAARSTLSSAGPAALPDDPRSASQRVAEPAEVAHGVLTTPGAALSAVGLAATWLGARADVLRVLTGRLVESTVDEQCAAFVNLHRVLPVLPTTSLVMATDMVLPRLEATVHASAPAMLAPRREPGQAVTRASAPDWLAMYVGDEPRTLAVFADDLEHMRPRYSALVGARDPQAWVNTVARLRWSCTSRLPGDPPKPDLALVNVGQLRTQLREVGVLPTAVAAPTSPAVAHDMAAAHPGLGGL